MGIKWFKKLGPLTTNWKIQMTKFTGGKERSNITWRSFLGHSLVSLKAMMRTIHKEGGGLSGYQ